MPSWLDDEITRARLRSTLLHFDEEETGLISVRVLRKVFTFLEFDGSADLNFNQLMDKLGVKVLEGDMVSYNMFIDNLCAGMNTKVAPPPKFDPDVRKKNARRLMSEAGVHPVFLTDNHWAKIWDKHFERPLGGRDRFDQPLQESYPTRNLRLLQWNLLAEGLAPEGFLSPLVTKAHIDGLESKLNEIVEADEAELMDAADVWELGPRNVVWNEGDKKYMTFARMSHEMISVMKGQSEEDKKKFGLELKEKYNAGVTHTGEQLTLNENALTKAGHRLLRTLWFVELLQPDVIVMQELDNFEYMRDELYKVGYACGSNMSEPYVPMSSRTHSRGDAPPEGPKYLDMLQQSTYAFAPKRNSNARKFILKRKGEVAKQAFGGKEYAADDDGCAIFWRMDKLRIVEKPEFCVMPSDADCKAMLKGEKPEVRPLVESGDQAMVRVRLEYADTKAPYCGQQFYVSGTHLSSGAEEKKEVRRVLEMGALFPASSLPEIWSLDANTEYNEKEVQVCGETTNAVKKFMTERDAFSIWDPHYQDKLNTDVERPVSVWKMRGSASAQPAKVGEDQFTCIDHIFFKGAGGLRGHLFERGQLALRLRETRQSNKDGTVSEQDRDWLALIPNEVVPSDHLPIVWDFKLAQTPRTAVPVLIQASHDTLKELLAFVPPNGTTPPYKGQQSDMTAEQKKNLAQKIEKLFAEKTDNDNSFSNETWLQDAADIVQMFKTSLHDTEGEASLPLALLDVAICMFYLAGSEEAKAEIAAGRAEALQQSRKFALLAIRNSTQALAFYSNNLAECHGIFARSVFIWRLVAQATECCLPRQPVTARPGATATTEKVLPDRLSDQLEARSGDDEIITSVMDSGGLLHVEALDGLIKKAKEVITSDPEFGTEPALLSLGAVRWFRGVGHGDHCLKVVKIVLDVLRDTDGTNAPAAYSASCEPQRPEDASRNAHREAAHFALKSVAASPNFDTGGGMKELVDALEDIKTKGDPEKHATLRDAVTVSFGKVLPEKLLAKVQTLDTTLTKDDTANARNFCAADALVTWMKPIPDRNKEQEVRSMGYILKTITRLSQQSQKGAESVEDRRSTLAGPALFFAPMLLSGGVEHLKIILKMVEGLPDQSLDKWRTSSRAASVLRLILCTEVEKGSVVSKFQQKLFKQVLDAEIPHFFTRFPSEESIQKSVATADVSHHVKNMWRTVQTINRDIGRVFPGKQFTS